MLWCTSYPFSLRLAAAVLLFAMQLLVNGSHSLHAISTGVSVKSKREDEQLHISSVDVPLVNVGAPNPLPNPCDGPDMGEGVSFNPVNNIWWVSRCLQQQQGPDASTARQLEVHLRALCYLHHAKSMSTHPPCS